MSVNSRNVVLIGNFGAVNLGDEILLSTVARWVADGGDTPIAISTLPDHTRSAHALESAFYADAAAIVEAIADADLVVLAGGGLFQDYDEIDRDALQRFPAFGVTQFGQYVYLAEALGVPCIALAQGVGPLRSEGAQGLVADVLTRVSACSVRDTDSAALLERIGVRTTPLVAPDPGWAWTPRPVPPYAMPPALAGYKVLAVNVRDWAFAPGWEDALGTVLARALPAHWGILWMDFYVPPPGVTVVRDAAAHRVLAAMSAHGSTPAHAFWGGTTADEALAAVGTCDAALTMRLHAALLAHRARRPTVALEYDGKVAALDAGIGMPDWQRVPLDEIATRLPTALAQLTGDTGSAFRMTTAEVERQGLAALAHRELLHKALARIPARELGSREGETQWLSAWWPQDDAAQRVLRALGNRVRRLRLRGEDNRQALDQGMAQLRRAMAERDAQSRERVAAEAAQAQSAAQLDAVLRSRSYRALAPLRRMSQWRARLASRTKK